MARNRVHSEVKELSTHLAFLEGSCYLSVLFLYLQKKTSKKAFAKMQKKPTNGPIYVEPSILSADFAYLAKELERIEEAGADGIHVDIMDGLFVPNLTIGPRILATINRITHLFLDVHIMVYHPFDYIEKLVENGADRITMHFEASEDVEETLAYIRKCNIEAGLAFSPETSLSFIPKYLDKCDLLLLMTVHPGFGGQEFMPEVLEKVRFARETCDKLDIRKGGIVDDREKQAYQKVRPPFDIQVDGGINEKTALLCVEAGANHLVSGTYLFQGINMKERIAILKGEKT